MAATRDGGRRDGASGATALHAGSAGAERVARGFDLLLGSYFREVELRLERLEAETAERLDRLEKDLLRHEEQLGERAAGPGSVPAGPDGEHRVTIAQLSRRLEEFEASYTERGELAALLVRAAQALAPDRR